MILLNGLTSDDKQSADLLVGPTLRPILNCSLLLYTWLEIIWFDGVGASECGSSIGGSSNLESIELAQFTI
jgi:hypothetical protein